MKTKIRLRNAMEVQEFVEISSKCDFNVDVQYRHFIFDGKSLIGLMNMDLSNELIVRYQGINPVFENMLKKYESIQQVSGKMYLL